MRTRLGIMAPVAAALLVVACADRGPGVLAPGDDDHRRLQTALIDAAPGAVVELAAGTFAVDRSLALDVDAVTLRGAGMDRTVLSFRDQVEGSEGLLITSDGVTIEALAVEDTAGDGVKAQGTRDITLRGVRVEWTEGEPETHGAYGLYPVQSEGVLVEDCVAIGASDAGIYVGQSENIVVRRNRAARNVAGIEIENSRHADVYDNHLLHNTGGLLVFDLPDLPVQGGGDVRVFANRVHDNNTPNFGAEGTTVRLIPAGTGVLVMASDRVEVFANDIAGHRSTNLAIVSYHVTGRQVEDPSYQPYPLAIHVHDNRFGAAAALGPDVEADIGRVLAGLFGDSPPDIVYDGSFDPDRLVDGAPPPELRLCIHDNEGADFANIGLASGFTRVERDMSAHDCVHAPLPPVELGGATAASAERSPRDGALEG